MGLSAFDFLHPDDREKTKAEFARWIRNKLRSITIENRQVNRSTGEVFHLFWNSNLHYDDKGNLTGINGIARDLTSHKKLEEELLKAQKLESIGILSGGIAHDFNNFLSIIMGNISMAKDDVKPDYGVTGLLNEAEAATLRAKELTKQLITFSKGGAPVMKIGSIRDMVIKTADVSVSGADVACEIIMPDNLRRVEFDQSQIKHAVNNILINALESMPDGGTIKITAENLTFSPENVEHGLPLSEGPYVKISIQDQGTGIPAGRLMGSSWI